KRIRYFGISIETGASWIWQGHMNRPWQNRSRIFKPSLDVSQVGGLKPLKNREFLLGAFPVSQAQIAQDQELAGVQAGGIDLEGFPTFQQGFLPFLALRM